MADPQVLFALRRRYAELLGRGGSSDDLAHVAAVLLMFSPREDVAAIKPIRVYSNRKGAGRAVWHRAAMSVLRTANEPMSAREIAARVLTALERPSDPVLLKGVENTIRTVLKTKASVVCLAGRPMRWALAGRLT